MHTQGAEDPAHSRHEQGVCHRTRSEGSGQTTAQISMSDDLINRVLASSK